MTETPKSLEGGEAVGDEGWRNRLPLAFTLFWNIPLALVLLLAIVGSITTTQANWLYFLWASTLPILSGTIAIVEPLRKRFVLPSISKEKSRNGLLIFALIWTIALCAWYVNLVSRPE
jgi:hypothetical protein